MQRPEKEKIVAELTERLRDSETLIVADYRGLSVKEIDELRTKLLEQGASFTVVKNSLTRRAAEAAGADALLTLLDGPTAIAFLETGGDAGRRREGARRLGEDDARSSRSAAASCRAARSRPRRSRSSRSSRRPTSCAARCSAPSRRRCTRSSACSRRRCRTCMASSQARIDQLGGDAGRRRNRRRAAAEARAEAEPETKAEGAPEAEAPEEPIAEEATETRKRRPKAGLGREEEE